MMIPITDLIVSCLVMCGGIIAYIIRLERRLTRIETKVDLLIGDKKTCQPL